MHRGHEHHEGHQLAGGAGPLAAPGAGHNRRSDRGPPLQWQRRHAGPQKDAADRSTDADLDLVEAAFIEGFAACSDPASFLRLAGVPFEAAEPDGTRLVLLRVEIDAVADVGSVTPHLGGKSFRYDPLPGRMISRRKRLRLIYFDGAGLRELPLTQATCLSPG